MKIKATIEATISDETAKEIAIRTIFKQVFEILGDPYFDDAGCDWLTDPRPGNYSVYIYDSKWFVIKSQAVHTLINAANMIQYGKIVHVDIPEYGKNEASSAVNVGKLILRK